MSETTSPPPFPQDSWSESNNNSKTKIKTDLFGKSHIKCNDSFLYPIDESEEFLDPYSDLNLYLSKKIKKEIQNFGSPKKWSHQIQTDLLSKLLPEFSQRFPKYRLGGSALRKIWDKVSYFYSKVQVQKGAIKPDGNLNVDYMIRENLKQAPQHHASHEMPYYTHSHQLAVKISECIATLDGIKPDLDQLTKTIWAVQRHLFKNLSPMNSKSPYEDYDKYDKVIVKTLLEITAKEQAIGAKTLYHKIKQGLAHLSDSAKYEKQHKLTSIISILLAKKQFNYTHLNTLFCRQERLALESFISRQIHLCALRQHLSPDSYHLDLIQKILTLYPIASQLPKEYPEDALKAGIKYIYHLSTKTPLNHCPVLPQSLYVFIQAEMHSLKGKFLNISLQEVEKEILKSYYLSETIPQLELHELDQLEMLIWKVIDQEEELLKEIPTHLIEVIENEIASQVIESHTHSFKIVVSHTLQYLRKIQRLSFSGEEVDQKIQIWSIQNDMLCRWIHFNQKTPLLQLIIEEWENSASTESQHDHELFIQHIVQEYLQTQPLLEDYQPQLTVRAWILYKFFWYNILNKNSESSYERFQKWHMAEGKSQQDFAELSKSILPLTPFHEK